MSFPLDHLSASSVNKFLRCPRQFQEDYIRGVKGPSSSAILIGSAAHAALALMMKGEDWDWEEIWYSLIAEAEEDGPILWKDSPEVSKRVAETMVYHYYQTIGRFLDVEETELEFSVSVPGVPIPVIGFIDLVTKPVGIDYKTTGYFSRNIRLNKEWVLAQGIYQLAHGKPSEIHVITRAKTDPVVIPDSTEHPLYIGLLDREKIERIIQDTYWQMDNFYRVFGYDTDWPGAPTHEWASKYCSLCKEGRGCQL